MSEKIKGIFGSEKRADEVKEWLKNQGAINFKDIYDASSEHSIYYVEQGNVKVINERYSVLFDIVELPRWRAKYDERYYYVSDSGHIKEGREKEILSWCEDDERYECGNYFKTKEEAKKYTEKFLEIFKEIKSK